MYEHLKKLPFDTVYLQPCEVNAWVRGDKEIVTFTNNAFGTKYHLRALALGNSPGTPSAGITAEVLEVLTIAELQEMDDELVNGKIVFFNRPFDNSFVNTFQSYGRAVDQRVYGPAEAAKKGAVAALVRSMTGALDTFPHTGVTLFREGEPQIPAIAISTVDAEWLSKELSSGSSGSIFLKNNSRIVGTKIDYTVIAEKRGSMYPDQIILSGGHLDSWDVGHGAQDDGAGCTQAVASMQVLLENGYEPRYTWRCVLFANEENGLAGGRTYAEKSNEKGEYHVLAIESDAGGFAPRGFTCDGDAETFPEFFIALNNLWPALDARGLYLRKGGSGADINPLKSQKGLLVGFRPDSHRYFDLHHSWSDTIDKVHPREISAGAAAMASVIYLVDKYGL
jgi:hypothetical protein